ncbi:hypothetical protein [Spirillospora sp. CA-294931]|uniref:hypothetical protein n=1 Tax=Spirillospora sp. CA-294931 TaxID=3240042 RepID=UPI003D9128B5
MRGRLVAVHRTGDDIYVATDAVSGRIACTFYVEHDGWWLACLPNGTERRVWAPNDAPEDVVRRLLRG